MSELKVYNARYEQVLDEVYLKSEADKVIAKLEADNLELRQRVNVLEGRLFGLSQSHNITTYSCRSLEREISELKEQKAQAEDDCAFWKTRAQKTADDNLVMAKQLAEKDAEIRKLNFQMWSARCEAAEAERDAPRLARCRYMADKFKEAK